VFFTLKDPENGACLPCRCRAAASTLCGSTSRRRARARLRPPELYEARGEFRLRALSSSASASARTSPRSNV
jgi:hypothetical protein